MDSLILRLGFALAIGLIVGLERGWREREAPAGSRTAGIRTYGLAGLLGGIMAALAGPLASPFVFAAGLAVFGVTFAWFEWHRAADEGTYSVTGVVAGLAVFGLGGLAVAGDYRVAGAGGVAVAGVLASREVLHRLLRHLTWPELRSALLLAAMTAIVLPLMPDRTVDPWGGVNPWEIWFFTVLTAAISFVGYIAVRMVGPGLGLLLSGLAGALVSSTAVTVAFGQRAKGGEPLRPLAGGAALAAMVSVFRVLVVVAVVRPDVALAMAVPALTAGAVFGTGGALLLHTGAKGAEQSTPKLGNPFDILPLLVFAVSFVLVAALSAAASRTLGSGSVLLTSAMSGMFDVDVAALTAARLAGTTISVQTAASAVLLAIALNGWVRVAAAFATGSRAYGLALAAASLAATASGGLAFLSTQ